MEGKEAKGGSSAMKKRAAGALFLAFLTVVAGAALSIPFVYESQTLWYKVGLNKLLLRGGQLAGLLAALSLCVQILLGARGKFLEEIFGVAALLRWHRINGPLLACLALLHMVLVVVPEGIGNLPVGVKFWPEMVGGLLLFLLLVMVISSQFRELFGLVYKRWRFVHRLLAYFFPLLVAVHVLFVSDSFGQAVPRAGLLTVLAALAIWVVRLKWVARQTRTRR
jgi:predicted ferric reductase